MLDRVDRMVDNEELTDEEARDAYWEVIDNAVFELYEGIYK